MPKLDTDQTLLGGDDLHRRRRPPPEKELISERVGIGRSRTFHCNLGGLKIGATETPRAVVNYVLRRGEAKAKEADLEHAAGDRKAVLKAARAIEETSRRRRGKTAERVLVTQTFELPHDASAAQRAAVADAMVADWQARGHAAIAAVHIAGEKRVGETEFQPHVHVVAASRPVAGSGQVDRSQGLWIGKKAVQAERARLAALVNEICRPAVEFHPGRLADTGLVDARGETIARPAIVDRESGAFIAFAGEGRDDDGRKVLWDLTENRRRYPLRRMSRASMHRRTEDRLERETIEQIADVLAADREAAAAAPIELQVPLEDEGTVEIVRQIDGVEFDSRRRKFWVAGDHPAAAELAARFAADRRIEVERERTGAAETRVRELAELSAKQQQFLVDVHAELGLELPNLATEEGRAEAFDRLRQAVAMRKAPKASPVHRFSDDERRAAEKSATAATARRVELQAEARAEAKRKSAEAARAARQRRRDDDRGL